MKLAKVAASILNALSVKSKSVSRSQKGRGCLGIERGWSSVSGAARVRLLFGLFKTLGNGTVERAWPVEAGAFKSR